MSIRTADEAFDRFQQATQRQLSEAMVNSRELALTAAIQLCEMVAAEGGSAAQCVMMLWDLRKILNEAHPHPSKTN